MKRIFALFLAALPSCGLLPRSTPVPVKTLQSGKPDATELIVFLPGRWSRVEEFEREGFFGIARQRWPDARLVAPDLHLGYYQNRSMARRLHEDVIRPARIGGVKKVTLVGISMGGLGALIYDTEFPGQANRIILLSPFLGDEPAIQEIESAGGLRNWRPGPIAESDFSRKLWVSLKQNRLENAKGAPILLGCANEDRLASSNRLFAREFLEPGDQKWITGAHDWPTWRALFQDLTSR